MNVNIIKKLCIPILFLFLVSGLSGGDLRDSTFKLANITCVGLDFIDVSLTLYAVSKWADGIGFIETDFYPVKKLYIKSLPLTFIVHIALNVITVSIANSIYKKNKTLGMVFIIGLNVLKGYFIYRTIRELRKPQMNY